MRAGVQGIPSRDDGQAQAKNQKLLFKSKRLTRPSGYPVFYRQTMGGPVFETPLACICRPRPLTAASGAMSARQALAVVREETQDDYLCPISLDYMDDPVAISMATGQGGEVVRHFSQRHLLEWLRHDPRNPFTREQLLPSTVALMPVDLVHLARIQDWRRRHPAS